MTQISGENMSTPLYDIKAKTIGGEEKSMTDFKDKVIIVVNVASKCGFTPQYEGLEKIYREYKDKGLVILGFPCNQFLSQEPGDEADIAKFCSLTYDVSFPMFAKVDVNGSNTHPLFGYLKKELPGLLGTKDVKWNFTKFLIDKEGKPVKRFAPRDEPEKMISEIEKILK